MEVVFEVSRSLSSPPKKGVASKETTLDDIRRGRSGVMFLDYFWSCEDLLPVSGGVVAEELPLLVPLVPVPSVPPPIPVGGWTL